MTYPMPITGPAPDAADLERLAKVAFETIPDVLKERVKDVVIRVDEFADDDVLDELGAESEFEVLGLYHGLSLDKKSTWDVFQSTDTIYLYRRPILDFWCETGERLDVVVRHVLIHEIGHHFGFSDEDMERIEYDD
ncbi:MAG TPA: metallopeptidase family protein [Alphaproteobacteria bacterium]|nr:metallopeptidase family protein [Alphaproteobacteria bacterium]